MTAKFAVEFGTNTLTEAPDGRLDAPSFHRNCTPIINVLTHALAGREGCAIEVGSGTGQHILAFARALPALTWWPSDPSPAHRRSIAAWRREAGLANLMAPVDLDASRSDWPLGRPGFPSDQGIVAIVAINVLHIAPWAVAEGLLAAAAHHLRHDGRLILYGPYAVGGAHTAPSNATFDAALRAHDPQWGVRDTDDIARLAAAHGLTIVETVPMPANNLMLILSPQRAA